MEQNGLDILLFANGVRNIAAGIFSFPYSIKFSFLLHMVVHFIELYIILAILDQRDIASLLNMKIMLNAI